MYIIFLTLEPSLHVSVRQFSGGSEAIHSEKELFILFHKPTQEECLQGSKSITNIPNITNIPWSFLTVYCNLFIFVCPCTFIIILLGLYRRIFSSLDVLFFSYYYLFFFNVLVVVPTLGWCSLPLSFLNIPNIA